MLPKFEPFIRERPISAPPRQSGYSPLVHTCFQMSPERVTIER
jgi:hypothetical protein